MARHSPVDRDAARPAEVEFNRSLDRLRALLGAAYERNEADKRALIDQARHWATAEDSTGAIDGVKQPAGAAGRTPAPPRASTSRPCGTEFRALCDTVFQRREQAYAAQASALVGAARPRPSRCATQVEQAARAADAERAVAKARSAQWRAAFEALGELPSADARALRDRFERALARYEAHLAQQGQQDAEAALVEPARGRDGRSARTRAP